MNTIAEASAWYTTQFITNSLRHYLENLGFRLNEPDQEQPVQIDKVVVATKLLSKERIEIRGTIDELAGPLDKSEESQTEGQGEKRSNLFMGAMNFLSDVLLLPVNFFSPQNSDEKNRCLCLPDIEQYREILEKVELYFISNQLHLKIYFVSQNGSVQALCLNPTKKHRKQSDQENQTD